MSDIQTGETFVDGQTVTGARLNNAVNSAVIQADFVASKSLTTPVSGDHLVFRQASSGLLKKTTVTSLNTAGGNVSSVGLILPSTEFNITGSPVTGSGVLNAQWKTQGGNKFLASPASGGSGFPFFRAMVPQDMYVPAVAIAASQIDWSLSNAFYKSLSGVTAFTFVNVPDSATIYVKIIHNLFLAHWPAISWPAGTEPNPSHATSIFRFMAIAGVVHGWTEITNLS